MTMSKTYPLEEILEILESVKIDPSEAVDDDDGTWITEHDEIVDKCFIGLNIPRSLKTERKRDHNSSK